MKHIPLGQEVKDVVTGLKGIATARVEYMNGCVQYAIVGKAANGVVPDAVYVDWQRLVVTGKGVDLHSSDTGGVMRDAPPSGSYRG